jgi:hypothetical protein
MIAADPPEVLLGLKQTERGPAADQVARAPAGNVATDAALRADQILDRIGGDQETSWRRHPIPAKGTEALSLHRGNNRFRAQCAVGGILRSTWHIYKRYLEPGSVRLPKHDLDRRGIVSKIRVSKNGTRLGGRSFSRGALYELLANPIYIGEIRHKKVRHPGPHEAIVDRQTWEEVPRRLRDSYLSN